MRNLIYYVYSRPLVGVVLGILIIVFTWAIINKSYIASSRKTYILKCVNVLVLAVEIAVVLYLTIMSRKPEEKELCLIPFYSFVLAQAVSEMYRTMLMNVLLFVPFGMTMPYALHENCKRKIMKTVLCAMLFSLAIEIAQYVFCLGRAEVDDLICNALGAAVGGMSYLLSGTMGKQKMRK